MRVRAMWMSRHPRGCMCLGTKERRVQHEDEVGGLERGPFNRPGSSVRRGKRRAAGEHRDCVAPPKPERLERRGVAGVMR